MKVIITSATEKEVIQIKHSLTSIYNNSDSSVQVSFHESGIGTLLSCFSITRLIFEQKPDLIIQAGIAGTFNNKNQLGKVVVVKDEMLADVGVEEQHYFKDFFDLNLCEEDTFPFKKRKLSNSFLPDLNYLKLEEVQAITINEITTRASRIEDLKVKYKPEIESMEGASLHYCCLQTGTPFIQIRAISNYIGERDKSKWNFKDALENLSESVTKYIDYLSTIKNK